MLRLLGPRGQRALRIFAIVAETKDPTQGRVVGYGFPGNAAGCRTKQSVRFRCRGLPPRRPMRLSPLLPDYIGAGICVMPPLQAGLPWQIRDHVCMSPKVGGDSRPFPPSARTY